MSVPAFNDSDHVFRSEAFQSVVAAALDFFKQTPLHPLPPTNRFIGSGVYGLYYTGNFAPYAPLVALNTPELRLPIYVGKAVPKGWRSGRAQVSGDADLLGRLREHARSITQAQNLDLTDFRCRFVILKNAETDLVGPVEGEIIRRFSPLWNKALPGFGLHDVGKERISQQRTLWDTLHPGRSWTLKLTGPAASPEVIQTAIDAYVDAYVKRFAPSGEVAISNAPQLDNGLV